MTAYDISYILLDWLVNNKSGRLVKLAKMEDSLVGEGFVGVGKIWLFPTDEYVFLHCGANIRTSPIKGIKKVTQDSAGTTVVVETATSIYEIFVDKTWHE